MIFAARSVIVLSSGGFKSALVELAPHFEKAHGYKLDLSFGPANRLKTQIEGGAPCDAVILTPPIVDALIAAGLIEAGSAYVIAKTGIGLAVRAGEPKPDVSTPEAFRRTLIDADSIAYTTTGQSGVHFAQVIEKLGIAAEVKAKGRVIPGGAAGELVARGEAQLAVQLIPELMAVHGIEIVGPFPPALQTEVALTAALGSAARNSGGAEALIAYLAGPQAAAVMTAKGLQPA